MEKLVTIIYVGNFSERQYQKQDGTTEYFKSRGITMKHGGDTLWGNGGRVGLEEPRYGVPARYALYRKGILETPYMAGPEWADTTRERLLHH